MIRKSLLVGALFFAAFTSFSQNAPAKFGDVSIDEVKMKSFKSDTSVAAIILFDKGQSFVSQGYFSISYKRHIRIKIFKKDGLAWANKKLIVERGSFSKLKGATYNVDNGALVKSELQDESIFKKRSNKYLDEVSFTLPNVKEGSVIEYSYTIDDQVKGWQFQHSIPTVWSEYSVNIPDGLSYKKHFKGMIAPAKHDVKDSEEKWVFTNVPAFRPEPFMPNEDDYVSQLELSFSKSTWFGINVFMLDDENFGQTVRGFPFLKSEVQKILTGIIDPREKMRILSNYVKENVEWDGTRDIYADDLKTILKKKKGTAADINLLLASMLNKAGIPVDMVLLSTRGNGFVRAENPTTRQFDYVICAAHIDTVEYLLDATEKFLPWDVLPLRCLNGDGYVVSKDLFGFIPVTSKTKERTTVRAELRLEDSGELSGKLTYLRDGYTGQRMRSTLKDKGKELYVEEFVADNPFTVSKSEFQDIDNLTKPAGEVHEIVLADHTIVAGDLIYVNPFVTLNVEENPFKPEERKFPIDFGAPTERLYLCTIVLPDGYVIESMPEPKLMSLPNKAGKYHYQVTLMGNKITVVSNLQINERVFMQDQYPNLRELYARIVAKQSEQIVLKKK